MGGVFFAYGTSLTAVTYFKYLGQALSSCNNDWPIVEQNLHRAQRKWGRLVKIFGREGMDMRMEGIFYVAVMQEVLLFGSETWVLTP